MVKGLDCQGAWCAWSRRIARFVSPWTCGSRAGFLSSRPPCTQGLLRFTSFCGFASRVVASAARPNALGVTGRARSGRNPVCRAPARFDSPFALVCPRATVCDRASPGVSIARIAWIACIALTERAGRSGTSAQPCNVSHALQGLRGSWSGVPHGVPPWGRLAAYV